MSEHNGSPRSIIVVFVFYLVLDFWLAWASMGLSVLFVQHVSGWESIPHLSAFALFSLSVDTVIVGEVDELEEDAG